MLFDPASERQAVFRGQEQVDNDHIRPILVDYAAGALAIGNLFNMQIGNEGQQSISERLSKREVIVDKKRAYHVPCPLENRSSQSRFINQIRAVRLKATGPLRDL